MSEQSVPNNPVVLLQQNLQVLRTITSQADEHTPITAFIAMQKNTLEAIKIMETHDKTDDFTIVPKAVVSLCRLTILQLQATYKRGILKHKDNKGFKNFVDAAKAKIVTYQNILDRLPTSEKAARTAPLQEPPSPKPCETCESYTTGECVSEIPCDMNYSAFKPKPCEKTHLCKWYPESCDDCGGELFEQSKPPGHRSDVKLDAKVSMEVERKSEDAK